RVPVARIQEVTPDNKIVLDLPAGEVDEVGRKPSGETDPSADFSDSAKTEKGALGLRREGGLS
ncbi:hypothetical protein OFB92_30545, partial [Escherichia coli]|nr:hypothetical protein [Escherichia coli]